MHQIAAREGGDLVSEVLMTPDATPADPPEPSFRALVEHGRDVFFRFRIGGTAGVDYLSPSVTDVTGYPVASFIADPGLFDRLVHPDDRRRLDPSDGSVGEATTVRWLRSDGSVAWIEQRSVVIAGPDGEATAIEGVARDVTTQRRALEAIRGSEHVLRALLDRIDLAAAIVDPDGRLSFANEYLLDVPAGPGTS